MKNLKKLVSVVLSLAMVISAMTFTASAKTYGDVETSSKYFEAIDILSSLGILQGDEQGNFNGDAEIKRSEFAAVVCRAMGQENAAKGSASEQRFTDVASNHWAAGYINWAAGQKIVNGKGDGIFDPDAPVKYEEAVKMLVSALGYEPLATRKGGYPTGYMVVAASNGINSGVSLAGSANAPRNIVAQLTYNALDVPLMDSSYVTKNGQDEYNIYDGTDYARRTLLSYYLDITKVKAVVDATSTSLESLAKKNGENQVRLVLKNAYKFDWEDILDGSYEKDDKFTLLTGDVNATDYIGYTVIAYVGENENDEYVLSAMTVDAKSVDTLEVTSNFETAIYDDGGKTTFEYYENENDLKTQSVDLSYKPTVYVNGRVAADEEEAFNAIPDNASKVVFMGDKSEGEYSMVFITVYKYALVDEVFEEDEYIKLSVPSGDLYLNPDDRNSKFTYTMTLADGTPITLADLEKNDLLNILCADPENFQGDTNDTITTMDIVVTRDAVEGTVDEEIDEDTIAIDGTEYEYAYGADLELAVNDSGRYFLTIDGKLFAEDEDYEGEDATSSKNYGFVTKMGVSTEFGEETIQLKMLTKDGSVAIYNLADTVYMYEYDDQEDKVVKTSYKKSNGGQAYVRDYFADAVNAVKVDSDYVLQGFDTEDEALASIPARTISYKLDSNSKIKEIKIAKDRASGDKNIFNVLDGTAGASYKENSEKFGGKTFTSKSVLFNAEPEGSDVAGWDFDEDSLEVVSFSSLDEDEDYGTPVLFDINSSNEFGLAVVSKGISASKKSALAVVTTTSTISDDMMKVTFFQAGETKSYVVSDSCDDLDDLATGDVFQYTLGGDEIIKGTVVAKFDPDAKTIALDSALTNTETVSYIVTDVAEVKNKYFTDSSDATYDFASSSDVGTVAIYNADRQGKNAVSKLSGLSSMKINSKSYDYQVVLRLQDDEVVDAIEYQTAK